MKVKDVMIKDVITCKPDNSVSTVARMFKENHISGIPVVEKSKVVGIISETDILKLFKTSEFSNELLLPSPFEVIEIPIRNLVRLEETKIAFDNLKIKPVKDFMVKKVHSISPDAGLEEASAQMVKHKVNRLPVIQNGELVGIVARSDIIRGLSSEGHES